MKAELFLEEAARQLFQSSVAYVNDILGHGAVMQVYDRAIYESQCEDLAAGGVVT